MTDIKGQKSNKNVVASSDYKSVDPTAVTLAVGASDSLLVTVKPTALTGAGNTVTVTVTDADTTAVITSFTVTAQTDKPVRVAIPRATRRVTVTPVGSGTRTTLTYSIDCVWENVTHAAGEYWNGSAYVSNDEKLLP